jgi:hypothetical protein
LLNLPDFPVSTGEPLLCLGHKESQELCQHDEDVECLLNPLVLGLLFETIPPWNSSSIERMVIK